MKLSYFLFIFLFSIQGFAQSEELFIGPGFKKIDAIINVDEFTQKSTVKIGEKTLVVDSYKIGKTRRSGCFLHNNFEYCVGDKINQIREIRTDTVQTSIKKPIIRKHESFLIASISALKGKLYLNEDKSLEVTKIMPEKGLDYSFYVETAGYCGADTHPSLCIGESVIYHETIPTQWIATSVKVIGQLQKENPFLIKNCDDYATKKAKKAGLLTTSEKFEEAKLQALNHCKEEKNKIYTIPVLEGGFLFVNTKRVMLTKGCAQAEYDLCAGVVSSDIDPSNNFFADIGYIDYSELKNIEDYPRWDVIYEYSDIKLKSLAVKSWDSMLRNNNHAIYKIVDLNIGGSKFEFPTSNGKTRYFLHWTDKHDGDVLDEIIIRYGIPFMFPQW